MTPKERVVLLKRFEYTLQNTEKKLKNKEHFLIVLSDLLEEIKILQKAINNDRINELSIDND